MAQPGPSRGPAPLGQGEVRRWAVLRLCTGGSCGVFLLMIIKTLNILARTDRKIRLRELCISRLLGISCLLRQFLVVKSAALDKDFLDVGGR